MGKRVIGRLISVLLVISIVLPLLNGFAFAASSPKEELTNWVKDYLVENASDTGGVVDGLVSGVMFGSISAAHVTPAELQAACNAYNNGFKTKLAQYWSEGILRALAYETWCGAIVAEIERDDDTGRMRLMNKAFGSWIVNDSGNYPYCTIEEWNAYMGGEGTGTACASKIYTGRDGTNKFVDVRNLDAKNSVVLSKDVLASAVMELNNLGENCSLAEASINGTWFYVIMKTGGTSAAYYCNSVNRPYVASIESKSPSVTNVKFDYTNITQTNNTDQSTDNSTAINIKDSQIIDLTNGILNMITENGDRITYNIDEVSYNFDDRSYTVNAYDITQNIENNYYEFNYYTYNIQYTYNNTYVTYIGSTAEYQPKEWALYYELPDGRSSADLTEEDIAGLSFQFQDMVNYKRSATDTSLRALYHFDGNVEDSSYWSTQGAFTWDKGASITYMESNAFNGALYLDEKEHQFTITLPSSIGSQDFTLQWRYYQNAAVTTDHNENYVSIGGTKLLGWSEQSLYSLASTKLSTGLSVGTWQELALVRNNGTLYIYHNGVMISSVTMPAVFTGQIAFYLGANSRAYSMMDELRVVNFAIAKNGAAYTPTSVPYDTNSVLVLPDGVFPIADEYWIFDKTITPWKTYSFVDGTTNVTYTSKDSIISDQRNLYTLFSPSASSFAVSDRYATLDATARSSYSTSAPGDWACYLTGALIIPLFPTESSVSRRTLTVSVVLADGSIYSDTQAISASCYGGTKFSLGPVSCYFGHRSTTDHFEGEDACYGLAFGRASSAPVDIVYIEIVMGDKGNTGHKFISAVYSSDEIQPNTAAIQSIIPVKGYTVGGVRPTFPERGDVWMPVEGSRISGVYIYNGQAWEETNARWWTGTRWIPIYAFDLVTLQDMWDVSSSDGSDVTPSINSEYGFWNWWKNQWLDFRSWLEKNLGGGSIIFPSPSECEHTYAEKVLTSPTCTQKGTALYVCSKCGDSYTETLDATGHDWLMVDSIPDELDGAGEVVTPGYDLYTCSICGEEYKDFTRTGPPGSEDSSTLSELIRQLFASLGDLVGSLVGWVLDLAKEAMDGFGSLGEYFREKAAEAEGFGGQFPNFLGAFFDAVPAEIKTCISIALILLGLSLFIRKVLM